MTRIRDFVSLNRKFAFVLGVVVATSLLAGCGEDDELLERAESGISEAQNLLGESTPIGRMRGRRYTHPGSGKPLLVTYHPAYLLRSPLEKRKVWADLLALKEQLARAS